MTKMIVAARLAWSALAVIAAGQAVAADGDVVRLCDFEASDDVRAWEFSAGTPALLEEGATHGHKALEITFDPQGSYHPAYLSWRRARRDWSGFDTLALDVFNPGTEPMPGTVLIADQEWAQKGRSYWNRHNGAMTFAPGRTRWVISVGGLYRGEAGSRNNDIKRNIDIDSIVRLDFGFGRKGAAGRVVIDDLRLIRVQRPAGAWAFDFGPDNQSVMPGWTPVSHATACSAARGFGWGPEGGTPWDGADRDTTFGPALLRDFCEAGGYRFHVDVPPGAYRVTVFYENSGYWGDEQAMQTTRRILVDGREAWRDNRPDGAAHALYRFEAIEPLGVDLWDTYMQPELAKPAVFDVRAGAGGLTLQFEADRVWGSRVAALALHRADDAEAARWLAGQFDEVAAEFRGMAVCLDPPPPKFDPPPAWKSWGLMAWPVTIEDDVTPNSLPPPTAPGPDTLVLRRLAVRDERTTLGLAVRAAGAAGVACPVRFEWLKAPSKLTAAVSLAWYNTSRGFNTISYRVEAHTLRPCVAVNLAQDVTRELVLAIDVPGEAAAGECEGLLTLQTPRGGGLLRVPVRLTVAPVVLDRRTDFRMGFFGVMPPPLVPEPQQAGALEQTLDLLRAYGMNMVCGGPDWRLVGWRDGAPVIDFKAMDQFVMRLRKHGFTGPLNGYGGARFAGLHDGYQKGRTGAQVERDSGLPYAEALMRAWKAVDAHARAADWPTIWYAMCDETRVRDVAERELAFMQMMAKVSAAYPKTVRTSGSYSVSFEKRPTDPDDMLYWHQRFFEALDISDLNGHDASVLAEARRLGKAIHIYNQGTSRYAFGLYQWSEFRHGIRARTQWHLNILHGYQFFDLDGREPDTAMICYGRHGLYPTLAFERCREGAQDFYLYNTLWHAVEQARQAGRTNAAVAAGERLLEQAASAVPLDQRQPPKNLDLDRLKADVVAAIEAVNAGR